MRKNSNKRKEEGKRNKQNEKRKQRKGESITGKGIRERRKEKRELRNRKK